MPSPDNQRPTRHPIASRLTLADLEGPLYPYLHALRTTKPVAWVPALQAWLVTRYDLAVAVMRDADTFTVDHPGFSTAQVVGPSMLSLDGAAHQQHRAPFERPFRNRAVHNRFRNPITKYISALLEQIVPEGQAELRRALAGPVAVQTMIEALGLEAVAVKSVLGWYDDIVDAVTQVSAGEPVSAAGRTAFSALRERLLPSLRSDPEFSLLAMAGGKGNGLTDDEIISNAAVLLFGGIETTEGMIANAIYHLLIHPAALAEVQANPQLIPAAVEESLRLEPAASVVDRYATRDVELAGAVIQKDDLVRVSLLGANRDPDIFPNPDEFDIHRPNLRTHVTFAQGPHVCLGLHLARLEAQEAIAQLLQPNVELRLHDRDSARPRGLIFRKPEALLVSWKKLPTGENVPND